MKLPNAHNAHVDIRKITEYLFNQSNPRGWAKGKFFVSRGFSVDNPEQLLVAIIQHPLDNEVVTTRAGFNGGTDYEVRCNIISPDATNPCVKSAWYIGPQGGNPKLSTIYPI